MKLKSVVLSMAVALFMIVMGNCFARVVNYPVGLPNGYTVHFKSWGGTLEKEGMEPINLPNEKNWMSKSDKDLICFMDDKNDVYIALRWYGLIDGLKLWKINIKTLETGFVNLRGTTEVFEHNRLYVMIHNNESRNISSSCADTRDWHLDAGGRPDGRYHIDHLGYTE